MKTKVFAVYDSKMEAYMNPFFFQTRGLAVRAWKDVANDSSTQFFKHPGDYTLFEIGEYDDRTGRFENTHTPISIGTALEFLDGSRMERRPSSLGMQVEGNEVSK